MIGKVWPKKPWRRPVERTIRYLAARYEQHGATGAFFEGLGRGHIGRPNGRCLIAFGYRFIEYLSTRPDVVSIGWDPVRLRGIMERYCRDTIPGRAPRTFASHSIHWQSAEMVRLCITRGFVVDLVDPQSTGAIKDVGGYDVIIDTWNNLPSWAKINTRAKTLFYADGVHWLYHNMATYTRHAWLFSRRGSSPWVRHVPPILSSDYADLVSSYGNSVINDTYGPNVDKIRRIWVASAEENVELNGKDWGKARRSFLYFGGSGWVHKGLDLVVEAFLLEPGLTLHIVAGEVGKESHFWQIYGSEIESAGNIIVHGFMDVGSQEFYNITQSCAAVVCPSCFENGGAAVVLCMHHGLLPLVTPNVGLDIHDVLPPIEGQTDTALVESIRSRCREISEMPEARLEELRYHFWSYARSSYTRSSYSQSFSKVLDELLGQT